MAGTIFVDHVPQIRNDERNISFEWKKHLHRCSHFFFSPGKNSAKHHPDLPQKSDFFGLNFKEAFVRPDRQNKDDSDVVPMPSTIRKGIDDLLLNFT